MSLKFPYAVVVIVTAVMAWIQGGTAAAAAPEPGSVGVRVEKPAGDGVHYSQGSGVFLGNGLVLTAGHVVSVDPGVSKVTIIMDGWRMDGAIVRMGDGKKLDLALIRLDPRVLSPERKAQSSVPVCEANPGINQAVSVASLGTVTKATTISTPITSYGESVKGWTNLLATGFRQGDSGGGVFDPARNCLWGVIAMELSGRLKSTGRYVEMTGFVPATDIGAFLDDYRRENPQP